MKRTTTFVEGREDMYASQKFTIECVHVAHAEDCMINLDDPREVRQYIEELIRDGNFVVVRVDIKKAY